MEKYLQEAFKAFDELNEDVFDISINDGLEKAKEFEDEPVWDDRENQIIIDPLAETEEELEKDYIGKAILQCEICQSMIYKNPDEVVIDEETGLANIDEACPFCQSEDGFKVIGEIKEFCDDEECEEKHEDEEAEESEEEIEEPVEDEEELDESIKTRKKVRIKEDCEEELDEAKRPLKRSGLSNSEKIKRTLAKISESTERDKIDADADDKKEIAKKKFAKAEDDADSDRDYKLKRKGLKESNMSLTPSVGKLAKFLEDSVKELENGSQSTYFYYLQDDLYSVVGVEEGHSYDKNDEGYARTPDGYVICSKVAYNYDELQYDYNGDWYMPYDPETGDVWDTDSGVLEDENFKELAKYHLQECKKMARELKKGTLIAESCNTKKSKKSLKESDKPAATSIEDAQKWVDYDMKKYGKISERTNRLVKKAGFQILKDDHGDYEVAAGKFESIKEDFNKVDIETDTQKMSMESDESGKVTVTTEPKTPESDLEAGTEVIAPVSDEVKAEFKSSEDTAEEEPEEIDYDFDEFEEKDFDSLGEGFLRKVYENVKSFKTTEGRLNGNNLMLEGLITFKSGKQAKTNFVFEAYKATKTGKLKFIGENKQFAKGKKSFTLSGKADGKKLVCESLTYNYCAKAQDGNSKRLYGTIRK